jgi:hypothetical protein
VADLQTNVSESNVSEFIQAAEKFIQRSSRHGRRRKGCGGCSFTTLLFVYNTGEFSSTGMITLDHEVSGTIVGSYVNFSGKVRQVRSICFVRLSAVKCDHCRI